MIGARPSRADRGQATVELALGLPVVLLAVLVILQVGLVVRDQIRTVHAAREAARASAVDGRYGVARAAALAGSGLDPSRLSVLTSGRDGVGSRVRVQVIYRAETNVPLAGALVPDPVLRAEATMRVEE